CRERLGDIRAIAVAGRHLFSGKARDENKGNAARHQNVRHGKGVMAVDPHVEQRGVQSLAFDRRERPLQGRDRTDDRPPRCAENRLDQPGNHRLVFDDQHSPARATATRLSMALLGLPSLAADIRLRLDWGTEEGGWHDNPLPLSLHCFLLRIERYPQIAPHPAVFAFDLRLSAEAMADFALDQGQAETMPRRLADRRAAALDPVQDEAGPAAPFDRPGDFERSAGYG